MDVPVIPDIFDNKDNNDNLKYNLWTTRNQKRQ